MICLYSKDETTFTHNGICVLDPSVCTVSEVAAGNYELYMEYPIDETGKHRLLTEDLIIKAPTPPTVIPSITLPETTRYTVAEQTPFYSKLPIYKSEKNDILTAIRANPDTYTYSVGRGYNQGAYAVYNGGIYQARAFAISVTPGTDSSIWGWIAPLTDSSGTAILVPGRLILPALVVGAPVIKVADYNGIYMQIKDGQGRIGFIDRECLTAAGTVSETLPEQTITDQLFRIYKVESDEEGTDTIKVYAKHISYDIQGNALMACKLEESSPLDCIALMQGVMMLPDDRRIACEFTEEKITKDWSFKNPINALLDPDDGLVPTLKARLVRNNQDFFILKNDSPRTGITIEHGNNMTGVTWSKSTEKRISRVVPRCRKGDNEYLYLQHGGTWSSTTQLIDANWVPNDDIYVDSPIADTFPKPKIQVLDCNFSVGEEYKPAGAKQKVKRTEANCREEMLKKAKERFSVDHCDGEEITLTVEFVLLGDTEEYKQYKGLQSVCLYDKITIKTRLIESTAQVTGYEYNCLLLRYNSITIGQADTFSRRVPGFRISNESITYDKLSPDVINRILTMNGSASTDSGSTGTGPTGGSVPLSEPNTKTADGVVAKGEGNENKTWATDGEGNPGWRQVTAQVFTKDENETLAWGTRTRIAVVGSTNIHVTMPANPGAGSRTAVNVAIYGNRVENVSSSEALNAYISGKVVVINCACKVLTSLTSAQTTLMTIPDGYRPSDYVFFVARLNKSGSGIFCNAEINTANGNINISHGGLSAGDTVRFQCVYEIA